MAKLICVMPVYNCADTILTALQSIDGLVDEIRCYDGKWIGKDGPLYSPDNTQQIIEEFAKVSKSKVSYWRFERPMYEWFFHNEILKGIENGDWLFKLDADEIILEWENVRETLEKSTEKAYRVCWHLFKPYAAVPNAKFFRKTETLYYNLNHREIFDKDGWIDVPRSPIIHILYDHQPEADTKKDRTNMKEYEHRNAQYEQSQRNQSN
jgi:glycosyltransferase involved in cell wall biosynthesis